MLLIKNHNNSDKIAKSSANSYSSYLPEQDKQAIIEWNHTTHAFPHTTLDALFQTQAKSTPDAPAFIFEDTVFNYQELDKASNQLAHFIRAHYIEQTDTFKPDTPIAIFINRSWEMMVAILAILKAGGAYVPIDPKYPAERIQYILNDTNTQLILTQQSLQSALPNQTARLVYLDEKPYQNQQKTAPEKIHEPQHLAYILYTSGTTGKPKGVAIPHIGVVNRIHWMQRIYPLTENDVILQKTPYCFDVSVWELLWAHQIGATLVMAKPDGHQDPLYLHTLIQKHQITTLHFVPSMLTVFTQAMADANLTVPTSLRYVFCSGEALIAAQVTAFYRLAMHAIEVHNLYGPTEASIDVTYFPCPRDVEKVFIGKPIQNTQIYILNEKMQFTAINEIGELYIGGIGLAREYLNKPELTKERFVKNPFCDKNENHQRLYKTGDLAKWTPSGDIDYIGRNDFQVKIRGFRIELNEIEHIITQYPGVRQSIVLTQEQTTQIGKNSYLVAYYTSETPISEPHLVDFLQQHLPEYMMPSAFIHLTVFKLTSNGKLDRNALPKHDFTKSSISTKARTPLEEKLVFIWETALNLNNIGVIDHFLSLGGHSLIAARIISFIKNKLNKTISFADFYRAKNIENLAKLLESSPESQQISNTFMPHPRKKLPLSDFQLILWLSHLFEPKAKKMNILMRKRLSGHLDADALFASFQHIFQKHEALSFQISKFFPTQKSRLSLPFEINSVENIQEFHEPEKRLSQSFDELLNIYPWPKQYPLVLARIFYLKNNQSELQLCMPHLIADERSMDILVEELSESYVSHQESKEKHLPTTAIAPFKHYLYEEQSISSQQTETKIQFWETYLQDARLVIFPRKHVVSSMERRGFNYSSYIEIPEIAISKLRAFCAMQHVNISDAVCSVLSKAIAEHQDIEYQHSKQPLLINLIKSTRETLEYDKTIGCFVRVDPIKVYVDDANHLKDLSKQIHNSMLDTAEEQRFSSLLKFACFMNCFNKKSWIKGNITRFFMPLYIKLIKLFNIQYESYKMFELCWRLASFKRKNLFLINLNLWNNFVAEPQSNTLFGMPVLKSPMSQYELSTLDFILDVCFIRDDATQKPYIVISCNLTPEYRLSIANRIINLMLNEM